MIIMATECSTCQPTSSCVVIVCEHCRRFIYFIFRLKTKNYECILTWEVAVVRYRLAKAVMNQQLCNRRRSRILRMVTAHLPCKNNNNNHKNVMRKYDTA